ncbi:hypothetical protein NJB1604_03570 [Mycobacterium marinum]|uniref:hypothetical protein n=1 Tax=Mycobacterium marinum TaxID=1781 RepID=UPI0021C491E5|nr:hypothetical protein [Mycobacterium marinum]GJO37862.1 hypothetical protein NJB1604_03570 [Mycobacterium marinum]
MKITADLSDVTIELKNKGITLHIADNGGKHVGDLRLGQGTGEWMKGRTREGNGVKFRMQMLVDILNDLGR